MLVGMSFETYSLVHDQKTLYQDHWNMTLPDGLISIYKKHRKPHFQNDHVYYEVFDVKQPSLLTKTFQFSDCNNPNIKQTFIDMTRELSIPHNYSPQFDHYSYQIFKTNQDYDKMYVLYDQKYLYILQNIF